MISTKLAPKQTSRIGNRRPLSCPLGIAKQLTAKAASASSSSSSSSSSCASQRHYDVFISFRGQDTRNNFTSHLHAALCRKNIETYIDYRIRKGDEISLSISKAIKGSSLSLVVFSRDYASSKWCLDELAQILECKKLQGQIVVPVFYKIDPSHVRKQTGSFKKAFAKHEQDLMHNKAKLNKWKVSLTEAANLAGWDSRTYRTECEYIEEIVKDVMQKLNHVHPCELEGLIGIDQNFALMESSLRIRSNEVRIIGIWGMGGIGKTTLANAIFAKFSSEYEGACFLENVREESEKLGLNDLRSRLLLTVLKDNTILHAGGPKIGSPCIMRRLSRRKVLIILDDVHTLKQLEYLDAKHHCWGPGSRVIITTRDKQVLLSSGVDEIYEVQGLSLQNSFQLFSLIAFNKSHPKMGYEKLSEMAVEYANGNPLALKVLGSSLHSRSQKEWDSALKKLMKIPSTEIQNMLRLSYDGLDDEEKNIFLDIACFFNGGKKEDVIKLLGICGFFAEIGIRVLLDKALITISDANDEVCMHDLIKKMGWEIVRQESINNPGRRSRLWDLDDTYDVLKNNNGTDVVEGIILDVSQINDVFLSYKAFTKMINLRFLKFYISGGGTCNLHIPEGLESLSDKLRYFHWDGYPSKSMPSKFSAENLVVLSMMGSLVKKLWNGVKNLVNLKEINLRGCENLIELPDFSLAPNLESVDLFHCTSLLLVPSSIEHIKKLLFFNLELCTKLRRLPRNIHLLSLEIFILKGCSSLDEFSVTSENMARLDLRGTTIKSFPLSIWHNFDKLVYLNLDSCKKLKSFECQIHLSSLEKLILKNCSSLVEFSLTSKNLEFLDLEGTSVKKLPTSIWRNNKLVTLVLRSCTRLGHFPNRPEVEELAAAYDMIKSFESAGMVEPWNLASLTDLSLNGSSINSLSISMEDLPRLKRLTLIGCKRIRSLPKLPTSLEDLFLDESNIECLPSRIIDLPHLRKITLIRCKMLRTLPNLPPSLEDLILDESGIESFPENMKDLCHIVKLPLIKCERLHSLEELPAFLEDLSLYESSIQCLPMGIKDLSLLRKLALIKCKSIQFLPELPPLLEDLLLDGINIESLPMGIKDLSHLGKVTLIDCQSLRSVPELPQSLYSFCVADCFSLETVPSSKAVLMEDRHTFYYNCTKLDENSRKNIIVEAPFEAAFASLQQRTHVGPLVSICLPGTKIPDWFCYQTTRSCVEIEIPQTWFIDSKLLGFSLCLILGGFQQSSGETYDPDVTCYSFVKSSHSDRFLGHCSTIMKVPGAFISDHIFICYNPPFNFWLMQDFKNLAKNNDADNLRLSLQFKGPCQRLDIVKKCGICPLLVSDNAYEYKSNESEIGNFDEMNQLAGRR